MGLSVVSQTLCRMDVFPAFALPIMRTRNRNFGIRGRGCCVSIGAMARVVDRFDPVLDRWPRSMVYNVHTVHLPYLILTRHGLVVAQPGSGNSIHVDVLVLSSNSFATLPKQFAGYNPRLGQ